MKLIYFRTPISRALERFKDTHPYKYTEWFRFRWVDVGRNITPKIDFHGIRVVYPQTKSALRWLQRHDAVQRNHTVFITSYVSDADKQNIEEVKRWMNKLGYKVVKRSEHIYDLLV